jgi:hypothetical protein
LGALLFDEPRHAPGWFLAFAVLLALSRFLQPYVRLANPYEEPSILSADRL